MRNSLCFPQGGEHKEKPKTINFAKFASKPKEKEPVFPSACFVIHFQFRQGGKTDGGKREIAGTLWKITEHQLKNQAWAAILDLLTPVLSILAPCKDKKNLLLHQHS